MMRTKGNKKIVLPSLVFLLMTVGLMPIAQATSLKESGEIGGASVMLSDVFTDIPDGADRILSKAPPLGQTMTLNARTLLRVAMASNLPWRPKSGNEQIVITRAAIRIATEDMDKVLRTALGSHDMGDDFTVRTSTPLQPITLPADQPATMRVDNMRLDRATGRFEAVISAPDIEEPLVRQPVYGVVDKQIHVPVLRDNLSAGAMIGERDIDQVVLSARSLRPNMIMNAKDLLGKTPKHAVMAGEPIMVEDVEVPLVVKRGEAVTMLFRSGPLLLSTQGKALENGAVGDHIRVVNVNSSKTVQAQVTNAREVTVVDF